MVEIPRANRMKRIARSIGRKGFPVLGAIIGTVVLAAAIGLLTRRRALS